MIFYCLIPKLIKLVLWESWLSPLLFNIYINDLIEELEKKFFTKAYADDLMIGLLCQADLHKCLWILQRWSHNNKIEINPNKSGILRVLGKILEIKNVLNIPEVFEYA